MRSRPRLDGAVLSKQGLREAISFPVRSERQALMRKKIHRRQDANPQEGIKRYGKATFADPVNNKYPIDRPGRIKAAWAYIHEPVNAGKYTDEEVRTIKARIRIVDAAEAAVAARHAPGR